MTHLPDFKPCNNTERTVSGTIEYEEASIPVTIDFDGDDESDCYEYAPRAIMNLKAMDLLARKRIVDDFLTNYNINWRDDEDPVLSSEQFAEKLRLSAINICGSSQMNWLYRDGGTFCGHSLIAQACDGLEFNGSTMHG